MEHHPRVKISDPIINKSKIILGSFPTWTLTNPDLEKGETFLQKEEKRLSNKDINFFYGSSTNRFWNWYQSYIDKNIVKENIPSIQKSLNKYQIGITDVIISCERKNKSALDKHLTKRTYNHNFLKLPVKGETTKILCTSKGVMSEMLLNKKFFKLHPQLCINQEKSALFQKQLIKKISGDSNLVKKPFYNIIEVEYGGVIECVSLPSPGSPHRRLIDFGYNTKDADLFLNSYLKIIFKWFIS